MYKNNPKISVIIPTYNHAEFIGDAINSVLKQTIIDFEIIVVNNYSKDNTVEIVESFNDKRIKLINFKNNGIIAASRNAGLKLAKGEYIAFLDSDDIWKPNKLKKQLEILGKHQDILLVASNGIIIPRARKKTTNVFFKNFRPSFKSMLRKNRVIQSSVLMKREILDNVGLVDETSDLNAVEDYDYWLRILEYRDRSIYVLKESLIYYRIHGMNNCLRASKELEKIRFILDKFSSIYPDYIDKVRKFREYDVKVLDLKDSFKDKKINLYELFFSKGISLVDKLKIVCLRR